MESGCETTRTTVRPCVARELEQTGAPENAYDGEHKQSLKTRTDEAENVAMIVASPYPATRIQAVGQKNAAINPVPRGYEYTARSQN